MSGDLRQNYDILRQNLPTGMKVLTKIKSKGKKHIGLRLHAGDFKLLLTISKKEKISLSKKAENILKDYFNEIDKKNILSRCANDRLKKLTENKEWQK